MAGEGVGLHGLEREPDMGPPVDVRDRRRDVVRGFPGAFGHRWYLRSKRVHALCHPRDEGHGRTRGTTLGSQRPRGRCLCDWRMGYPWSSHMPGNGGDRRRLLAGRTPRSGRGSEVISERFRRRLSATRLSGARRGVPTRPLHSLGMARGGSPRTPILPILREVVEWKPIGITQRGQLHARHLQHEPSVLSILPFAAIRPVCERCRLIRV